MVRAPADLDVELEDHRRELTAYAYRMLGSAFEAEDAVQETMLRAWRSFERFEGRSTLRSWLYRIATNVCLDMLSGKERRARPMDLAAPKTADAALGEALPEATWILPIPDGAVLPAEGDPAEVTEARETIRLAFIAALQHLPARQRAALILREVLGFSARETAEALDSTTASVNSALQRARRAIDERLPARSQQATLRELGDDGARELVERFTDAFERADVEAIVALLADDAVFAMPPYAEWYSGREAVARSWLMPSGPPGGLRYAPTRANGQIALGTYALDPARAAYVPIALDVLTLRGGEIAVVYAFRDTGAFARFGLPATVPQSPPRASR
jgi:RNA polymerase sigma-70 factor, ECF subfamily